MFRIAILFLSVLPVQNILADALACVDPDVAAALVGVSWEGPVTITRDWHEDFPTFAIPKGFTFIGSRDADRYLSISFKTTMPAKDALDSLQVSLNKSGWEMPDPFRLGLGYRERASGAIDSNVSFCHADHSVFWVSFSDGSNQSRYITLIDNKYENTKGCNSNKIKHERASHLVDDMPTLTLPNSAIYYYGTGNSHGTQDNMTTDIVLISSLTPTALLKFFGGLLSEQDWQKEAQWAGKFQSGSSWRSNDHKYSGTLHLVSRGSDKYKLIFTMMFNS